ncbi:hypothetical protein ACLKA6_017864 [Drosophila palustris]
MVHKKGLLFVLQFFVLGRSSEAVELIEVLDELNVRLGFTTNIIYNPGLNELEYLQKMQPVSQLIISSLDESHFKPKEMIHVINEKVLFVLIVKDPPLDLFQKLKLHFEYSDFLLVIEQEELGKIWLGFVHDAWQLGYIKLLLWHASIVYEKKLFPELRLRPSSVQRYAATRGGIQDLHGHEIRVAVYHNPPRCTQYKDKYGNEVTGGFYMRFIQSYVLSKNATFVAVQTTSYSAGHCKRALVSGRVDVCADSLAQEATNTFAVTRPLKLAFANILVPNAKPLGSYRYLAAPFLPTVWMCLVVYIGFIVCFMSCIHWQQQRRWIFSKFLLEAISSLLFAGFSLKDLRGRERYILFMVLFLAGFIFSTFYLGYLKSLLTTEVFEEQINSFEQLVAANISLLIDEYDRNLTKRYHMPDILWKVAKVVPDKMLKEHRNAFDPNYAYMLFTDRMHLFDYAQKYLKHPHLRHIPINIMFLFAGFPMRDTWFLKHDLSQAWSNAFSSGLIEKHILDAFYETTTSSVGFLKFLVTEYYEAQPLGLDYFVMPAMSLGLGYGLALIAFVVELTGWRTSSSSPDVD